MDPSPHPNVLFIIVDDLRPQLQCYGRSQMVTPHLDALAARGMRFDRHYCQEAICAPSRCNIMTGCRPDTLGIYGLDTPLIQAMPEAWTLPRHFKDHGYHTGSIGKVYHHDSDKEDPQAWSQPSIHPRGEQRGRGYLSAEAIAQMERADEQFKGKPLPRFGLGLGPSFEAADVPDNAYNDGRVTDQAVADLERLHDERFFLAVGYARPHLPCCAPKKYWDLYPRESIQLPDNYFAPENATPYTLTNFGEWRRYCDVPDQGPIPDELAKGYIRGYYASVSYLDAQIGRLMEQLDHLNLRDNTVVVFCVDHATKLGEHAAWSKHTVTEVDTRIPLIVCPPDDRGADRHTDALTENVDIYPTLCDLCDLPMPEDLEGVSLTPLLDDPDRPWKSAAFMQYPRHSQEHGKIMGYALRTDRHRYVEWQQRETGEVLARELYDHHRDPEENINLADQPEQADTVTELAGVLKKGWQAATPG